MLSSPLSFLLCTPVFPHSTTMFVFRISAVLFHSSGYLSSPLNPDHLLSKRLLTARLLQFSPSYLWLFLCLFLFPHEGHFAYHHTVLLCDVLIYHYLTIAHFLQVPPAHYIIDMVTFSATFILHPVFSCYKC